MNGTATDNASAREILLLDSGWLFHRGGKLDFACLGFANIGRLHDETRAWQKVGNHGVANPANTLVDAWPKVNLPHDFVIEGAFIRTAPVNNGSLPGDEAWYVKKFELPESDRDRRIHVEFDGVYRDCSVFFNGQLVGRHLSGYTSFGFDLSDLCRFGKTNALAVHVAATENELWSYEGGGIYRSVRLVKTAPVHIPMWGVYVRTGGEEDPGRVDVEATVRNESGCPCLAEVRFVVLDPRGRAVAEAAAEAEVAAYDETLLRQMLRVEAPLLWSRDTPRLYALEVQVAQAGRVVDRYRLPFGIRHFRFDPERGFFLNGRPMKLKGVCCHQDHAGVGVALPAGLQEWRVRRLKELGCNAIRTSHNPPDPALLDACDRLGMMVMDEIRLPGTSGEFLADFESLVRRDRNHPSVILWSLGNEEMDIQKNETGVRVFSRLQQLAHRLDPSRPATYAMNCDWVSLSAFQASQGFRIDVFGANYRARAGSASYDLFHGRFPDWPIVGTETWGGGATRGLYESDLGGPQAVALSDEAHLRSAGAWGDKPDLRFASAWGNWRAPWGAGIEEVWRDCASRPFLAGTFLWTGFDYRGEVGPYTWPAVVTRFGILDLCGFSKEIAHYLRAWWRPGDPHVFVMPHWNWEGREGEPLDVRCYANTAEVEIFLNGTSFGRKAMPENDRLEWRVPYEPGELKAVGYDRVGREVACHRRRTAKAPAAVVLSPGFGWTGAGSGRVIAVDAAIVDADGELCPRASNLVEFAVEGPVEVLGVGNGNPLSHEPDKAARRFAFHGLCQVILQAVEGAGTATLTASSAGLGSATLALDSGGLAGRSRGAGPA